MRLKRSYDYLKIVTCVFLMVFVAWFLNGLTPAEASNHDVVGELSIPAIGLHSEVVRVLLEGRKLNAPDTAVGAYYGARNKVFLIGHQSTAFHDLDKVQVGDMIEFDKKIYAVNEIVILAKEEVDMNSVLAASPHETIVVMTCAGRDLGGGDATHRLIVSADVVDK